MALWDAFIFGGETDILECRLTEYAETSVYRHVIVEANVDHQGHRKPYYFLEHKDRFSPFMDRIIYIKVDHLDSKVLPGANAEWHRLARQRDAITRGLHEANGEDIILFGDCDEILSPLGIAHASDGTVFRQRFAIFCVDWEDKSSRWDGPRAVSVKNAPRPLHRIRNHHAANNHVYDGWHLTWMGGPEAIKRKMMQYCHSELNDYIWENLNNGRLLEKGFYWGQNIPPKEEKLVPVAVDSTWPKWIHERQCPENWFREFYQKLTPDPVSDQG